MKGTLARSAILMLIITVVALAGWEIYLRNQGLQVSYDDGPALWAHKRAMVYEPADRSTVFIGSSRIKFDLDIPTWERTGDHAIQLAMEGSCPRPILEDLAADENFKGRLIVDVTEGLFFSPAERNISEVVTNINHYHDLTPAQRASFAINRPLESTFVFLDEANFSLNSLLYKLRIPSRPGVFMFPIFPRDFHRVTFDREAEMTEKFVADTSLQNEVIGIWGFFRANNRDPLPTGDTLHQIMVSVKEATDKIKARGGQVMFVRTPSSGPFWHGEQMAFPREKYWDALLKFTDCPGIHFNDYPKTANFQCPELSHLTPKDGEIYTAELVKILNEEHGWSFPKLPAPAQ